MEQYSWKEIGVAIGTSMVSGGVAFQLIRWIWAEIKELRKKKTTEKLQDITNAAELQKVVREDARLHEESVKEAYFELYKTVKAERDSLRDEIKEMGKTPSFTFATTTKIYTHIRRLRYRCDQLERMVESSVECSPMENEVKELRAELDALDKDLPQ